jgi:transcriptional regulator EpsA
MSRDKVIIGRDKDAKANVAAIDDVAVLSEYDRENFLRAVEFALPIRKRYQFFVWSQNYLQALLPHELLLCAYGEYRRRTFTVIKFSATRFDDKQLAEVADPRNGLMIKAIDAWHERGKDPLLVCPQINNSDLHARFRDSLEHHGLANLALHGTQYTKDGFGSFFGFARVPCALSARHAYLIELILPHLHMALLRTLALEESLFEDESTAPGKQQHLVTAREIQILRWVQDGKNSREIGVILNISALTVKNHVQNILRKLNAQNRAQAVARALALRLLT